MITVPDLSSLAGEYSGGGGGGGGSLFSHGCMHVCFCCFCLFVCLCVCYGDYIVLLYTVAALPAY